VLFVIKKPTDREKVIAYLTRLPITPLGWRLLIEKIRNVRSTNQRKYMWYIFELIAKETDNDKQVIHDYYCQKFLTVEIEIFGKMQKITRGTSQLNTKEQETFMLEVRTDAQSELNIFCPLPNETIYE
jgi:hypothetical protein